MRFEVTYLYFDDLRTVGTDSFSFTGQKLEMGERATVPYAVLRVIDTTSGEVINDLTPHIGYLTNLDHQSWGLKCLLVYPALLCLRRITCTFRRGDKPHHYAASVRFATNSGASPYEDDQLTSFIMNTWKCSRETYPHICQSIPEHLHGSFVAAAWSTMKRRGPEEVTDEDEINILRDLGLME